jgi:hypothetical protein
MLITDRVIKTRWKGRILVLYRLSVFFSLAVLYYKFPIFIKVTWHFVAIGLAGYINLLVCGVGTTKKSATYKAILFFELWMIIWNGFRWNCYGEILPSDNKPNEGRL